MPKFANVNNIYNAAGANNTHQQPTFALKTALVAAGWQVKCSGDGLSYSATGDIITHSAIGPGGLTNHEAWFVVEEPGAGRRQWCIQSSGTTAGCLRVKYSALAKFVGGSPGSTRVPAAADEKLIYGGGTDVAPSYLNVFPNTNIVRYHVIALSHAISGAYGFYVFCTNGGGSTQMAGMLVQEPMLPGTYSSSDGDPVVVYAGNASSGLGGSHAWFGFGTPGQTWAQSLVFPIHNQHAGAVGSDLGDGKDVNTRPWWFANISGAQRAKGCSAVLASRGPAGRAYPATINRATDSYVYLGAWLYPYPNDTEPSIA